MQKHVNLVDLVKSFPTNIFLQNLASIQKRTSPVKFAHLAEKSEKGSISNLSTKASSRARRTGTSRTSAPGSSARWPRGSASRSYLTEGKYIILRICADRMSGYNRSAGRPAAGPVIRT